MHRKLLLALLAGNVLLRFFTNAIGVLPRALNLWDVIVTIAIVVIAIVGPKMRLEVEQGKIVGRMALFSFVCILGSLLNGGYFYFNSALSQWLMWCEPLALFVAISYLPVSRDDYTAYKRVLLWLAVIEIVIGIVQAPFAIKAHESEIIIGTFFGNAEQYQFFILIAVFFLLARREVGVRNSKLVLAAITSILILIVLIDNKASWFALFVTLAVLLPKLATLQGKVAPKFKSYALLGAFGACAYLAVSLSSATASAKFGGLIEAVQTGSVLQLGKIKALRDVLSAYGAHPQMAVVGSGLGTFYSRAAFEYFPFRVYEMYDNADRLQSGDNVISKGITGVIAQASGVDAFYRQFYSREKIFAVGSGTADFPTSSYISILGETGLLGAWLYLTVHFLGLRKAYEAFARSARFPDLFPFAAATFASLLYLSLMGVYNYWIESGRVNTIVWSMLAITLKVLSLCENAWDEQEADALEAQPEMV